MERKNVGKKIDAYRAFRRAVNGQLENNNSHGTRPHDFADGGCIVFRMLSRHGGFDRGRCDIYSYGAYRHTRFCKRRRICLCRETVVRFYPGIFGFVRGLRAYL